jgi:hypothetical protein
MRLLSAVASPGAYVGVGALFAIFGLVLAVNYRGFSDWYLRLIAKNLSDPAIIRYRILYACGASIGAVALIYGLVRM